MFCNIARKTYKTLSNLQSTEKNLLKHQAKMYFAYMRDIKLFV